MASEIVIGAGLSGIALAYELLKRGIDVEIIEHRARIGGLSIIDPDAVDHIEKMTRDLKIATNTTAIKRSGKIFASSRSGVRIINKGYVATGFRVMTLPELNIFGDRPSGVYPFHTALDLIMDGLSPGTRIAIYGFNRYSILLARTLSEKVRRIVIIDPKAPDIEIGGDIQLIRAKIRMLYSCGRLCRIKTDLEDLDVDTLIISIFKPWNPFPQFPGVGHSVLKVFEPEALIMSSRLLAENIACSNEYYEPIKIYIDSRLKSHIQVFPPNPRRCLRKIMVIGSIGDKVRINNRILIFRKSYELINLQNDIEILKITNVPHPEE